jgi:hypothetical protein
MLFAVFIPPDPSSYLGCSATHHSPVPFSSFIIHNSRFFPAPFLPHSASLIVPIYRGASPE